MLLLSTASMAATAASIEGIGIDLEIEPPAPTVPYGMVSYWQMNETAGIHVHDSIGINHGTLRDLPEDYDPWIPGVSENGLDIPRGAYVDCGGDRSLNIDELLTIEAWVFPRSTSSLQTIVQNGWTPDDKMYHFAIDAGGSLYFDRYDRSTNPALVTRSVLRVPSGGWHHVAVVMDTLAPTLTFYLDGYNMDLIHGFNDPYRGEQASRFAIGYGQDPNRGHYPTFFNGYIDEVAVHNVTLSDADIIRHYENGLRGLSYLVVEEEAPVANDDAYATDEDVILNVAAPGVLTNDIGSGLTAVLEAEPSSGTLALYGDGSFDYTPAPDFNGFDTFSYTVTDGITVSNIATVTITVNAVNDAPIGVDDEYTINEDEVLTVLAPGVLANDYDVDGDTLTADLVDTPPYTSGSFSPDGSFSVTPLPDWNGVTTLTYQVFDGTEYSGLVTVTINVLPVNDAPVGNDDDYTIDEDTSLDLAAPGLLENDNDVDEDDITLEVISLPAHGSGSIGADGSFSYTPNPDWNGIDSLTYQVFDGSEYSEIVTVTITVLPVNDVPIGFDDQYTINEDEVLSIPAPGVLGNDYDVDEDSLTASLVEPPPGTSGSLSPDGALTVYFPSDWNGITTLTYQVFDGTAYSDIVTVTITVNPVNDAPVAMDDYVVMDEDTSFIIDFMGNDYDVDDSFSWDYVAWVPTEINGELEIVYDYEVETGVFRDVLRYTPNPDWHGSSSTINYRISDTFGVQSSIARIYITVNSVNDAPVAVDDYVVTDENTPVIIDFMANDYDIEGDSFDWAWVGYSLVELHGTIDFQQIEVEPGVLRTVLIYTPDPNWYGSTSTLHYAIRDSLGAESLTAWIYITVNPVNDPPVANDDAYSTEAGVSLIVEAPGVLANDEDIDGDPLEALLFDMPMYGTVTLNPDGSFTYNPAEAWCGVDTFTYYAFDGLEYSEIATVTITVVDVTPPVTAIEFAGDAGEYDWYYSDVEVTLTATDDCSGVASTMYSLDALTWMFYTEPFVLTDPGEYTIYFYSTDNAGNVESTKTSTIKIAKYTRSYAKGVGKVAEAEGRWGFFSFNVKYRMGGILRGHAMYMFKVPGYRYFVWGSAFLGMIIDGNHAILEVKCTVKQYSCEARRPEYLTGFYLRIEVWDNGKGHLDMFQIQIFYESGDLFHAAGFDPPGNLLCGNIRIGTRSWKCWCKDP
jgi:hypothetical protein